MSEYFAQKNTPPRIGIVVAVTRDGAIGKNGDLVVKIADDLKRFRVITSGHPIIMGRKTFDSIGRILPNRMNVIVSRNQNLKIEGAIVCSSFDEALERALRIEQDSSNTEKWVHIIGGADIFRLGLPKTDRLFLTLVESDLSGDVFFPDYSAFTKIVRREDRVDEGTGLRYSWIDLER